jgi:hypothetical protein
LLSDIAAEPAGGGLVSELLASELFLHPASARPAAASNASLII